MKEIKSVRVRRTNLSTDDISNSIDYKVTLFSDDNKNFKVSVSQPGKTDLFSEYKKQGRFKKFSNDDFIKSGIDILIASNLNNKSTLGGGGSGMGQFYFDELDFISNFPVIDNNIVYLIIQDPWSETPPPFRNFGFDPYYINNGSTIIIRWLKESISSRIVNSGGFKWSDNGGNELPVSKNNDSKIPVYKTVMIISPNNDRYYVNFQGTPFFDNTQENILKFSGSVSDISIINNVLNMWINNVFTKIYDRYDLSICDPNYKFCENIPYFDPIDKDNVEKLEESEKPLIQKEKLNVVIPKNLQLRIKQDFSFKIFVGDPPKTELPLVDGFDFGDEDDLSDLLLEDEFRESQFEGNEEEKIQIQKEIEILIEKQKDRDNDKIIQKQTPNKKQPVISDDSIDNDSIIEYRQIVTTIKSIYLLQDKLNNGNPLFKDFKKWNDDEDGAVKRLRELFGLVNTNTNSVWWNKINLDGLTSNHRELFVNQLPFLLKKTTTSKKMFKFSIPHLKPGEGKKEININSDF